MRKITVLSFITLDGVQQAPGGPEEDTSGGFKYGGWTFPYFDEYAGNVMAEQMDASVALLLGRKPYDIFAGYWPDHLDEWPQAGSAPKSVASHGTPQLTWDKSVLLQ